MQCMVTMHGHVDMYMRLDHRPLAIFHSILDLRSILYCILLSFITMHLTSEVSLAAAVEPLNLHLIFPLRFWDA